MPYRRRRLGELDLVERFSPLMPALPVQFLFGSLCVLAAIMARYGVNMFAPDAGPYAPIYPAILIATLFGRWQAGLITFVGTFAYAWYFVLPDTHSFHFLNPSDGPRTLVNGTAAVVIAIFAELFRRAIRRAAAERDRELETHQLLLRELDHRTKNNFAMVASLLEMQRRHHESEEVQEALAVAGARVHSFAAIHDSIYSGADYVDEISMPNYLASLTRMLSDALFMRDTVTISLGCDAVSLPRDRAVAIGLVMNEVVTNAAKHAFEDGQSGEIRVEFRQPPSGRWVLSIVDDGKGMPSEPAQPDGRSGLGSRLMDAFARKAGGELTVERPAVGTRVLLVETELLPDTE
ncbi:sensor histidine kinase [Hyphomonas johnsonii]|uniref:histidine kinase n=1 Tax=Hyphomonas johnsonii MHS-2 TaxID=1280950 RepID=A0A059FT54_9PROT|nr:histidine kinase dimerization/phosphoacceptor domain -containing protein [Hyphomonas johnsonii]KCZ93797.1 signal transduction histidine kinase [Hyphomonas johnsonii MHS-2]